MALVTRVRRPVLSAGAISTLVDEKFELVRQPTILARHHLNSVPSAWVNGSPWSSQPPTHASNSPNGRSVVDAPRRGDSYGILSITESLVLSHGPPASRRSTFAPARVSV